MRLERLEITGFGRLRDVDIDFEPGVTVLLGANETGKSTVQRAIRAALYGIDAGGQGRAVERSDWTRWAPWSGVGYGLALTYGLADGRRIRVARRLDGRDGHAQVQEIGGPELTDEVRSGRQVTPGLFHLGIDEAVFCATACLSEESLRADAPDGATQQVERLQEAVERLADSGSGVSAAQALARLREASQRIGTERRTTSPYGQATVRLREVEAELNEARRRVAGVAQEQQRLRGLEDAVRDAERLRVEREREWLVGRLAALAVQERELAAAEGEVERVESEIAATASAADFPVEDEDRVIALGGELAQSETAGREADERAAKANLRLATVTRRRSEIAAGLRALGSGPDIDLASLATARKLAAEVAAEGGLGRRLETVRKGEAQRAALTGEIASTGLGAVPIGQAPVVADLLVECQGGSAHRLEPAAGVVLVLAAGSAGVLFAAGHRPLAAAAAALFAVLAGVLFAVGRFGGGRAAAARRELRRRCPGLDVSEAGLQRARERIGALEALHEQVRRQDVLLRAAQEELEADRRRIAALVTRCDALAAEAGLVPDDQAPSDGSTAEALLRRAHLTIEAVESAAERHRRRAELRREDAQLVSETRELQLVTDEAERRADQRAALEATLRAHLLRVGTEGWTTPAEAVAMFREGCALHRRHRAAGERLSELHRHIKALGIDQGVLQRLRAQLHEQLRSRNGGAADVEAAVPLGPGELQALEDQVESARRRATSLNADAEALRGRLAGMLEGLPSLADLEDERRRCEEVRTRSQHQLEALRRATTLIEEATRGVHRQVAPRLAAFVGDRLALLTEGRYDAVNVDTERFAVTLRGRDRPDLIPLELVSHGTRDQVSLLLRLALNDVFSDAGEAVPLLLDEPLLTADPERRSGAISFLARLAVTTQVVVTTSDPATAAEIAEQAAGNCAVVELVAAGAHEREKQLALPRLSLL